ncbi:MAG TPA: HAMP domain-containing sensor histidine kinase [Chitinophagaceae bacterium]
MKKLRVSSILMIVAILGIAGFQGYWLKNNYDREKQNLDITTAASFRQTILKLQASKLKIEQINLQMDSTNVSNVVVTGKKTGKVTFNRTVRSKEPAISLLNVVQEKMRDSVWTGSKGERTIIVSMKNDSMRHFLMDSLKEGKRNIRTIDISHRIDSLLPDPRLIKEIHVEKANVKPLQSISSSGAAHSGIGENVFVEGHLPPLPVTENGLKNNEKMSPGNAVFRFLYDIDSLALKDSVTVKEVTEAYSNRLKEEKINIAFKVDRYDSSRATPANAVTIGFSNPTSFGLTLQSTFSYMFGKLKLPILFSLLLVGITIASFVLLYRNMMKQKRLADLKNEFISNITHELKTPIATVGVAIEALKSFNAIHDPKRTQEYLDISQNELQRLNLLVDKVLKLSMFEKKEIDLKYETLNLKDVVDEVITSMRLQIEKYRAVVSVNTEGDCFLQGDRLHLLSVVFNLLDNSLKYGKENSTIHINLEEKENTVQLTIADNGIGIPSAYKDKVFEKFFRIPHGDTHNAKGYGLGLSYTAHVIKKHRGTIAIENREAEGATFVITLPKQKV